ncbi:MULTISPECIES: hypothetical protein [Paenibacillus]|uniref:Uncharacterized protein n=1 Tax=Paenibacillus odorifer TaxID=189426 RepID=A0ABX3GQ66_9BACL|nr:hypothetical protein [Paenibacillus odorifer]OMD34638.1 hypothetical protein BSO21_10755 [Paenibacillus odorifer]
MNEKKDALRFHREEIIFWLDTVKTAQYLEDPKTEQFAKEQRRQHTEAVNSLWASPAEQLAVCI